MRNVSEKKKAKSDGEGPSITWPWHALMQESISACIHVHTRTQMHMRTTHVLTHTHTLYNTSHANTTYTRLRGQQSKNEVNLGSHIEKKEKLGSHISVPLSANCMNVTGLHTFLAPHDSYGSNKE